MKLPNCEQAYIPVEKLANYLLSETHKDGRSKAKLLTHIGYNRDNLEVLEHDLLMIAQSCEVKDVIPSEHGTKYVIEGILQSPSGLQRLMTTVWITEVQETKPRFVTAYPSTG
jgi:hypothetical protein